MKTKTQLSEFISQKLSVSCKSDCEFYCICGYTTTQLSSLQSIASRHNNPNGWIGNDRALQYFHNDAVPLPCNDIATLQECGDHPSSLFFKILRALFIVTVLMTIIFDIFYWAGVLVEYLERYKWYYTRNLGLKLYQELKGRESEKSASVLKTQSVGPAVTTLPRPVTASMMATRPPPAGMVLPTPEQVEMMTLQPSIGIQKVVPAGLAPNIGPVKRKIPGPETENAV